MRRVLKLLAGGCLAFMAVVALAMLLALPVELLAYLFGEHFVEEHSGAISVLVIAFMAGGLMLANE